MNRHFKSLLFFWVTIGFAFPAYAQESTSAGPDTRALRWWYGQDHPVLQGWMKGAEASAYPAFAGVPAVWVAWDALHQEYSGAGVRLVVAQGAAIATTMTLKRVIRRERPYINFPGIEARTGGLDGAVRERDGYAFPSGHATLAFALATSVSLSHPEWYVAVPAYTWATSVGAARVWHGVHYPTDVLAGAATGTLVAWLVHHAWPNDKEKAHGIPVSLSLRF